MTDSRKSPKLVLAMTAWTFSNQPEKNWDLDTMLAKMKSEGADAVATFVAEGEEEHYARLSVKHGLRFGGAFDAANREEMAARIPKMLKIGNGPINCQLADHDTSTEEAVTLAIALMEEADRFGADVHLEVHRDTCTETPEKTAAIIEGYEIATGKRLKVNFDYSHPAIIKHLGPHNYADRLIDRPDVLQDATLLHCRPFNGHHCQIPITNGKGTFSEEFEEYRPFLRDMFRCWLQGPLPGNELWVVPELGPKGGYGLSVFPDVVEDSFVLSREIRAAWRECLVELGFES